jgi:hypothetical protein
MKGTSRFNTILASLVIVLLCHSVGFTDSRMWFGSDEYPGVISFDDANGEDDETHTAFPLQEEEEPWKVAEGVDRLPAITERLLENLLRSPQAEQWTQEYLDVQMQREELTYNDWQAAKKYGLGALKIDTGVVEAAMAPAALTQNPSTSPSAVTLPQDPPAESPTALAVSLYALNFGTVSVNASKELTFLVINKGSTPLSGRVAVPSPHTVVAGDAFTLTPGASQMVTVRFHPTNPGIYFANATVQSNDGKASVSLRGVAKRAS